MRKPTLLRIDSHQTGGMMPHSVCYNTNTWTLVIALPSSEIVEVAKFTRAADKTPTYVFLYVLPNLCLAVQKYTKILTSCKNTHIFSVPYRILPDSTASYRILPHSTD